MTDLRRDQGSGHGAAITLVDCAKTFADGTRALEPTSIEIAAGETIVLLGPSGCGKTTTLRIIAGLETPDAGGRVLFDGSEVTHLPIERRNVGMVFQSYALFPNMNVAQNIAYGLRVRGASKAEQLQRADEVMAMMRIGELRARRIDQLSGGQRQRVALARALAVRPRALLLDEPLTALDAALREHLRAEIDTLLKSLRITAIYVTHDQAEALALGDRVVVMQSGEIAQIGTPRDIYFRPATSFVADFVGVTNRLKGRIENGAFVCSAGRIAVAHPDREAATLAFRPETARVTTAADAPLRFEVVQAQFLGPRTRLVLSSPGQQPVIIEGENRAELTVGNTIGVAIAPETLMVLP